MKPRRAEVLTSNLYKAKLVELRQQIEQAQKLRDYNEWVARTNAAIAEINRRIRATNRGAASPAREVAC